MIQSGKLLSARSVRVVAAARALLAASLLLAVTLVPPPGYGGAARAVIQLYTAYAVALALVMRRREVAYRLLGQAPLMLAIDAAVAIALVYLASGADTPFFSPVVFLVVSATIQWGARGALVMGLFAAALFVPSGLLALLGDDPDRGAALQFVVRLGYLLVITVLLVRFGGHVERVIDELGRLTDPLREPATGDAEPPAQACLDHALRVFGATRGAVVWAEPDEPHARLLRREPDGLVEAVLLTEAEALVAVAPDEAAVALDASGASFVRKGGRVVAGPAAPLDPALAAALGFQRALAIRATADDLDGWVMVFDHDEPASEDLAIGAMVSAQVSVAFQRWRSAGVRREIVAGEERIRLARDLHDGVLQFLAGTSLQLEAIAREGAPAERMDALRAALADEQRELRGFIAALNPERGREAAPRRPLADELTDLGGRLGQQWGARVAVTVSPPELTVAPHLLFDLTRFVREGVANAVRHGGARAVTVTVARSDERLALAIRDDGRGFGFVGVRDHDAIAREGGPRTLHERANALGGRLAVDSGAAGSEVALDLPIGKATT